MADEGNPKWKYRINAGKNITRIYFREGVFLNVFTKYSNCDTVWIATR